MARLTVAHTLTVSVAGSALLALTNDTGLAPSKENKMNQDFMIPDITERPNHAFQLHEVEAEPDGEVCTICGDYSEDVEDGVCDDCREAE